LFMFSLHWIIVEQEEVLILFSLFSGYINHPY